MRSICLEASSSAKLVSPVTLPPGCDRLFTRPKPTGSAPDAMTMGIALVALAIARLAGTGEETTTFGLSRTSSAARAGSRSRSPSANRYSKRTLRPSMWPRLRRPSRNASIRDQAASGSVKTRVVDGRQAMPGRQCDDQRAMDRRARTAEHNQAAVWSVRELREGALDLAGIAYVDRTQLHAKRRRQRLD